ncbi:hypothetical protein Tco_0702301 [Tanacetum coccineum]|uniref:Uncharacterized protein n=1 Tax=Tanacetum coccineum TaxID=301880 RepID=A0ABQ4XXB3_9ASTR
MPNGNNTLPSCGEVGKIRINILMLMIDFFESLCMSIVEYESGLRWNDGLPTQSSKPEIRQLAIKDEYGFAFILDHSVDSMNLLTGVSDLKVGSSNTDVLDSPCLLVIITGTSQSRQHGKSESDSYYLSD